MMANDSRPLPPLTASPAQFKPAPVYCWRCGNRDRSLIDVSPQGALYCAVCSNVWREK